VPDQEQDNEGTRHTALVLERLRSAGFVKEAVVGDTRYVYLTERACGLLVLHGYSAEDLACSERELKLISYGASAASATA